jgi:hypothetical protein
VFWVAEEEDKEALVADPATPYFTTPHFDGHPAVLVRLVRIPADELAELVEDAWRLRAPRTLLADFDGRPRP